MLTTRGIADSLVGEALGFGETKNSSKNQTHEASYTSEGNGQFIK